MRKRQSVRTFDTKNIDDSHFQFINEYLFNQSNLIGPFGGKSKIELVQVSGNVTDKGIKLGTYGLIKNPRGYLVGLAENSKYSLLDFAYCFHNLLLHLTELGMGTCWMGGTFSRNSFEKEIEIGEGEFIPGISPIGYPSQKQRVMDKALRYAVKADNKKSWEKLFYDASFEVSLAKENAGEWEIPIEMVRLGPSASNKQPWRLVLSADRTVCHFYIEHTPNYSSKLGYDMQLLDMGIAMCQFDLACRELKMEGQWLADDPKIGQTNEQIEYIVSWKKFSH
ncbi:MAG: nitroreductase [Neobacillus sp.]|nr:nitroreductase [Neobacillus sp.]